MTPNQSFWKKSFTVSNLLSAAIIVLALAARLAPGARTIDDSYITYRYARNLLSGQGLVFNPGERVLGTTTPLYAGLMAALGLFSGGVQAPFPQIAMIVNALADGLTCLLLLRLGRRFGFRYAGFGAALVWAIAPHSVTFAIGGLETSVFVLLLLGAVAAHLEARRALAALLGVLAFLTRPDAIILIGPLMLDRILQWWTDYRRHKLIKRQVWIEALIFTFPALAWFGFATLYYGSPIPHSIAAKSVAYRLAPEAGLVRLLQHYATPFMEHKTFGTGWIGVGLILYPFLYLSGARQALKTKPCSWPLVIFPWFYLALYALANPLIFRWYLTPPLPPYFLLILGGAEGLLLALGGALRRWTEAKGRNAPEADVGRWLMVVMLVIAPTALSLREWRLQPDHGLERPAPEMAWYKLELLYRQAAEIVLRSQPSPAGDPTLAAGDVGVLGYVTRLRILDTVGLNSPASTRYYPADPAYYVINYAIPPALILDALPEYIVILEVYGRRSFLAEPAFWQQYRLVEKLPTDIYGSDGMLILERIQP